MASQTQGIQQLLTAEKRAAEKIAEARKRKIKRLVQAKQEAKDEIEKYRLEREKQYKEFEAKRMGSQEHVFAKIDNDTQQHLKLLEEHVINNNEAVIEDLLSLIIDVEPKVNPNYFIMKKLNAIV